MTCLVLAFFLVLVQAQTGAVNRFDILKNNVKACKSDLATHPKLSVAKDFALTGHVNGLIWVDDQQNSVCADNCQFPQQLCSLLLKPDGPLIRCSDGNCFFAPHSTLLKFHLFTTIKCHSNVAICWCSRPALTQLNTVVTGHRKESAATTVDT